MYTLHTVQSQSKHSKNTSDEQLYICYHTKA